MSLTTIKDTRVRMRPTEELIRLIDQHKDIISEVPENVARVLSHSGVSLPAKIETVKSKDVSGNGQINTKLLNNLLTNINERPSGNKHSEIKSKIEVEAIKESKDKKNTESKKSDQPSTVGCLYLSDLRWLNNFLTKLRKERDVNIFLHNVIEKCSLILPENEVIERNPELEARCKKLREEQQNREYRKMTKSVDAVLKHYPEDSIAYQMKALNSQIIAVLQFVFSVAAGFVFGFLGVELLIGNLDFGFRLLLGVMCALIIALAEIYFLAKKLNEFDDDAAMASNFHSSPTKNRKVHTD